jgi:prophage regulatory protein
MKYTISENNSRVLRLPQVMELTGLSRSSIYAGISQGNFPVPVRLGARAVGWRQEAIEQWLAERPLARPQSASPHNSAASSCVISAHAASLR